MVQPLKPVLRIANERDREQEAANKLKEKEAYRICLEKIQKHELEMKLIDAEYTFDNNKVLFYFTADGRIDFRELVKDLASVFKTRIELRQIGVRDETKILGGIGICGRPLCCHTHLSDFIPVSIKMAKEQNLSLNPTKISGVCGRLVPAGLWKSLPFPPGSQADPAAPFSPVPAALPGTAPSVLFCRVSA